jgi:hypothetical protein
MRPGKLNIRRIWIPFAFSLLTPLPAIAQVSSGKFELTPFAAYRGGGTFEEQDGSAEFELSESNAWGLIINGKVQANTQWEVLYANQSTSVNTFAATPDEAEVDIDVEYLHIGGTYLFDGGRFQPFIAATIGASHFSPKPSGFGSKTLVSGSLGGGWKISLAKNLALRIEARGYATLVDDDNRLFCESSGSEGSCLLILEGSFFTQWETRAGLTFRF